MALALGISSGTVGSRLHRARQKLAPILAQEARDE
ncbi:MULTISPECIES: sigma factor-like helix-turn-helix DNA-binding protein [unclassified Amycolatopsis]|nr:sigma factor-like helix-turn-helix DNA-binding protein [Amycolatopsis sp. DSM 110486]